MIAILYLVLWLVVVGCLYLLLLVFDIHPARRLGIAVLCVAAVVLGDHALWRYAVLPSAATEFVAFVKKLKAADDAERPVFYDKAYLSELAFQRRCRETCFDERMFARIGALYVSDLDGPHRGYPTCPMDRKCRKLSIFDASIDELPEPQADLSEIEGAGHQECETGNYLSIFKTKFCKGTELMSGRVWWTSYGMYIQASPLGRLFEYPPWDKASRADVFFHYAKDVCLTGGERIGLEAAFWEDCTYGEP